MDLGKAIVPSMTSHNISIFAWFTSIRMGYILLAILFVIVLVMYFSPSYVPKIQVSAIGPFSLGSETSMIDADTASMFYRDTDGSFSAFVYLSPMNRTGAYAKCGTNPNQASCEDGTFVPCPCDPATNNCSICNHSGYKSIFNIAGVVGFEVLNAPDASRQGKAMSQLIVQTEGPPVSAGSTNSQKYIETLQVPPIPIQKWTMVTVGREGRRFDIYYNDILVLSQKTMYMPISNKSNTNYKGVTSGSDELIGQIAMANLYTNRISSGEIRIIYKTFSDTRGRPYLNSGSTLGLSTTAPPSEMINRVGLNPSAESTSIGSTLSGISVCPGGCFDPPPIRAASPLYQWSTPYA